MPPENVPPFDKQRLYRQLGLFAVLALLYSGGLWLRRDKDPVTDHGVLSVQEQLALRPLVLTQHGRCRMECREISLEEVQQALRSGRINMEKSRTSDQPCPTWALETFTEDGQHIRVVFAGCDAETRVVTAIDLNREYVCACD